MNTVSNQKVLTVVLFFITLAVYHLFIISDIRPSFINAYDFDYFMHQWIVGTIWFNKNFLTVPWFTPTYCMSFPFYPNPQNLYYSISQVFFILFSPMTALRLYLIFLSTISFWGMWLFVRRILKCDYKISFFGAVLFMFNGYLSARYLSSHYAYAVFAFVPLYLYFLHYSLNYLKNNYLRYVYLTLSSLVLSQVIYSGGAPIIPHILISIFFILVIFLIIDFNKELIQQYFLSFIIFLTLSSSKIYAGLKLLNNFPRDHVEPLITDNLFIILKHFFLGLFLFPDFSDETLTPSYHHEVNYSLTLVPIIVLMIGLWIKKINFKKYFFKNTFLNILFLGIVFFPIVILYDFKLFSYLRSLPVINNMWVNIRFFVIYLIPIIIFTCLIVKKFEFKYNKFLVNGLTILIITQSIFSPKTVGDKIYDLNYDEQVFFNKIYNKSYKIKKIYIDPLSIGGGTDKSGEKYFTTENTGLIPVHKRLFAELTPFDCYEPILGFRSQAKPFTRIIIKLNSDKKRKQSDPIMVDPFVQRDNKFNFNNPICEIFPNENSCKSLGDNFKSSERQNLENLLNFKPLKFNQSFSQKFFNFLTLITLFIIFGFYLLVIARKIVSLRKILAENKEIN